MRKLLLVALLLSPAAYADLYDQPYSIIQTDGVRAADYLLRPVIVNRVDDENALYGNRAVVGPGVHKVTLDLPPRQGFRTATQVTFELQTQPCTRYYVAARLRSSVSQRWDPVVRSEEPIGECVEKFRNSGAK
jgi:hypothetical protein